MRHDFLIFIPVSAIVIILLGYFVHPFLFYFFILFIPLYLLGFYDMFFAKETIIRNFPIVGRLRFLMEQLRPKIYQYFIESDTNGTPINRVNREMVYNRAKLGNDTEPFGTQYNVYEAGYEWMTHSIAAKNVDEIDKDIRFTIGGPDCKQPYSSSILNVSAMSFGALSKNAVRALNGGAKIGNFAQNTGEGGISPYHLELGGDLIFQFGSAYFGVRDEDGNFSPELFKEKASYPAVKMIEIKLSQGAKPGHGGMLPAIKNTEEIAAIRHIKPHVDVLSPPHHTAFSTPIGLMHFVKQCRDLSGGKPVGFKLCIGSRMEFISLCKAMVETGIKPDFITIDGGEGGTGAAPHEFSDSIGMPYREGLAFAYNALVGFALKKDIKLIASGKVITGFDLHRAFALGADGCNAARAMMLAIGCIQALECHLNTCPTGITTQDPELVAGLDVNDKRVKVANYHRRTIESFREMLAAAGLKTKDHINRHMIHRRLSMAESKTYAQIYPYIHEGSLLHKDTVPEHLKYDVAFADPTAFEPRIAQNINW